MEITARTNSDFPVLDLNGRLYLGPATKILRDTVYEIIKQNPGKIVLNMRNVTHIDSCGLGELISCYSHAKSLGQNLVLLNPQDKTMRLLVLTKLETIFDIFYDEVSAVADSKQKAVPA
jgi:anti-sigma B factor antagonist